MGSLSRAEKGELIGVGIGLVVSLVLGVLALLVSSHANTAAQIANNSAEAANGLASQALELQRAEFLADASSDAGKAAITFKMHDYLEAEQSARMLIITVSNRSPRPMMDVTFRVQPVISNIGSSTDPAWESDLGRIPGCTESVYWLKGDRVADFPDINLNGAVTWTDTAGSRWAVDSSAARGVELNPPTQLAVSFTSLPLLKLGQAPVGEPGAVAMYAYSSVAIPDC